MVLAVPIPKFLVSKDTLGIDIGSQSIKITQLKISGKKWVAATWTEEVLSLESISELSPPERKSLIIDKLKEIILRERITTKKVCASISGSSVIVRYVKFPKLAPEQLAKTIEYEAEPYIPFAIADVHLGFHIVKDIEEDGQKKMETILVAVKKDLIQERIEILQQANLNPTIIDIDAFALGNALEAAEVLPMTETVVAVNVGATVTNLVVIENGVSKVVRDIFVAGNNFTKAVQRNLGVDFATAEQMKRQYGIQVTPEEKEEAKADKDKTQVSAILSTVAKELTSEIQRSIDYFLAQSPETAITKVILTGGSVALPNLTQYVGQELNLNAEAFKPSIAIENAQSMVALQNDVDYKYAVAFGLGVRKEGDSR
ncbi:MAG: type IV pilus assembly protein PilM [Elusimicrobiota bacterium]